MKINGLNFLPIPAGEFRFGTPFDLELIREMQDEYAIFPEWILKEMPESQVYLNEFFLAENLLTFRDFHQFFADNPEMKTTTWVQNEKKYGSDHPAFPVTPRLSYFFCQWFSKLTSHSIRPPTEFEWEKAARGPEHFEYPWGNNKEGPVNTREKKIGKPDFSQRFQNSSGYGIKDMGGNLEEMTCSVNRSYPGLNVHVPTSLFYPILKGGTCEHDLDLVRNARRHGKIPSQFTGLRPCLSTRAPKDFSVTPPLKTGGFSFATIDSYDGEYLVVSIDRMTGICDLSEAPKKIKNLLAQRKTGSEVLVKILSLNNKFFTATRPKLEEFHQALSLEKY